MKLNDQLLLKNKCFINGEWLENGSQRIKVHKPFNGQLIDEIPNLSKEQVVMAISAASEAFETWQYTTVDERSNLLKKWLGLIIRHELDLARIISDETGKPLPESLTEVRYGASYVEWFAEEAKRINGDVLPSKNNESQILITKEPVGVCAMLTPWNFPNAMVTRKIAPALASACTVVLKPSELTPFSALALVELADRAGFPKGVINLVTGDATGIGQILTTDKRVRKISFTGSTKVGEILQQQSINTHKSLSMELGGNAPFIIFADAHLDEVIKGIFLAKFRNAGQTCIAANRILVHKNFYPQFIATVKQQIMQLKMGDPYMEGVEIGPLINQQAVVKMDFLVQDAISKGAELLYGGGSSSLGECFYNPTVLVGVTPQMAIFQQEIFGPILAITLFEKEDEAIMLANMTDAGLAAYCFTKDMARIRRVTRKLKFGMLGINSAAISYASIPFGGIKYSGKGREGSHYGINEYLELKYTLLSVK